MRALLSILLIVGAPACMAATPAEGQLRPFDAKSMSAIRAAHAGKPFILAFWSLHCAPCLEDLPDWAPLRQAHPHVPILLVATDPPREREAIVKMLAPYRLQRVETWLVTDEFVERVRYSVDRTWRGELPRTYFFDAAHRPQIQSGRIDVKWVETWYTGLGKAVR